MKTRITIHAFGLGIGIAILFIGIIHNDITPFIIGTTCVVLNLFGILLNIVKR